MTEKLLDIEGLSVHFPTRRKLFVAVNKANLAVEPGEIHGLVGESGAGKSTIGAAVMGLLERPGHIAEGTVSFKGEHINGRDADGMRALRGAKISMIFQDPLTSLNPLLTVGQQLVETIQFHLKLSDADSKKRAIELLDRVGIPMPDERINQYPHQFSGGMRQRVVIALALCSEPDVIIADEPTTALDVSIQAQILELIKELARERQTGVVLITHDMGVIADTTDKVTVMYQGEVVESGSTEQVLGAPAHEYTKSLIAAVPRPTLKVHRFPQLSYGGRQIAFHIDDLARNWDRPEPTKSGTLLKVEGLTKTFLQSGSIIPSRRKFFTAVDKVSFDIREGEVFGIVGESGSGKSTVANALMVKLMEMGGRPVTLLDGDIVRKNLSSELGFSKEHRDLNIRRIGYVASEITKNGGIAICAPIAPYAATRRAVREDVEQFGAFVEVHVATSIEECERRDRKGLYKLAREGKIKEFTGISDPYDVPQNAELVLETENVEVDNCAHQVLLKLENMGLIAG